MNSIRIEVNRNYASGWIISPANAGGSALNSAALTPLKFPRQESRSSIEPELRRLDPSLDEQLFDNTADLKIAVATVAMRMSSELRDTILQQLDELLSKENWQYDSALINTSTFVTFLRFVVYTQPTRLPSLGVGPTGHILAAWAAPACQISVEFLLNDRAAATFVAQGLRAKEAVAWRGHVADLKDFLVRNEMIVALQE
jgi:hypothetical protein